MPVKQFNTFLEEKIKDLETELSELTSQKDKLSSESKELLKNKSTKKELIYEYYKNQRQSIITYLKPLSETKLIENYINTRTKEYNEQIKTTNTIIEELQCILQNFDGSDFISPYPATIITLKHLIEYGYQEKIAPQEILRQIIMLSKLTIITEEKNSNSTTLSLKSLGNIFDETLAHKDQDKKTIEFILQKLKRNLNYEIQDIRLKQYTESVILSLDKYKNTLTEEKQNKYKNITSRYSNYTFDPTQTTIPRLIRFAKEKIPSPQYNYERTFSNFTKDQLMVIHHALDLKKKEPNKNLVKMLKKAICEIISLSSYLESNDINSDPIVNEELLIQRLDFLLVLVKNITIKNTNEPFLDYLINKESGYPIILEDIRALDDSYYPDIKEAIETIDYLESILMFEKQEISIYKAPFKEITLMYAKYKNSIVIITAVNNITESKLSKNYYPLIIEQIKRKYDKKAQIIYNTIVEREINIFYTPQEEKTFIKNKKENQ